MKQMRQSRRMHFLTFWVLMGLVIGINACKKEEKKIEASTPPTITFVSDDQGFQQGNLISGAQGKTMTLRATLDDQVGVKSFLISYPEWDLHNTVIVSEYYPDQNLLSYDLEYQFLIPEDAIQSQSHQMKLIVTNLGDLQSSTDVIVSLDGDYDPPVITNLFPGNNMTVPAEELQLSFEVTDNMALDYVVVDLPSLDIYDSIYEFENPRSYSYARDLPELLPENYAFGIRTSDKFKNEVVKNANFNIGTPSIIHLFLADVSTQEELDRGLIGTTLRMLPTGVDFEHSIVYYCAEEGTEIRFMDHFDNFSYAFNLFGANGDVLVENGMDSPLILDQKGYYWITCNTDLLTISVSDPISPNDVPDARTVPGEPWLFGRGVDTNHGGWDTYSDYMSIDDDNLYLFHIETPLGDAENEGYCEGCIGIELNGNTEWNDEYIWDDILWFGYHWYQDDIIDEIDANGGKPEGWAGRAGELETWSDEEENYWNVWTDLSATYRISQDMYTRRTRIFRID